MSEDTDTKEKVTKRKVGRPTTFNAEVMANAEYYLENFEESGNVVPTIAGLSLHLDVSRTLMYDWSSKEENKEFLYMLNRIKSTQENILINKGLKKEHDSGITRLMLAKHGYHEKAFLDVTTGGDKLSTAQGVTTAQAQLFDGWAEDVKKLEGLE